MAGQKKNKVGTGPNDYRKGNRTRGDDRPYKGPGKDSNTTGLEEYRRAVTEQREHFQKIAETMKNRLKYNQEYAAGMHDRIQEYIDRQLESGKSLTMAGIIRASEVEEHRFYRMLNGEYDYLCYEAMAARGYDPEVYEGTRVTDEDGTEVLFMPMSTLLKAARLAVQEQREEYAMDKKNRNAAGPIFLLKSAHGFREEEEPKTVNNTMIVAPEAEIKAALSRLG